MARELTDGYDRKQREDSIQVALACDGERWGGTQSRGVILQCHLIMKNHTTLLLFVVFSLHYTRPILDLKN